MRGPFDEAASLITSATVKPLYPHCVCRFLNVRTWLNCIWYQWKASAFPK